MLRVGLTGELGSGKSTVAAMLAEHGAIVLSSDEMGRAMMQPGQPAFAKIIERFGPTILNTDGTLNRGALAKLAFDPQNPRIEELNAIIHPAVIAAQAEKIAELARTQPHAIVIIESALIFSTKHAPGRSWRERFDVIVLVTASEEVKIERFIARVSSGRELTAEERLNLQIDAHSRLAQQHITTEQAANCIVIENSGSVDELETKVDDVWRQLNSLLEKV